MVKGSLSTRSILDKLLFAARKLPKGRLRQSLEVALRGLPSGHQIGCRAQRINTIANCLQGAEDYLEIGVQFGFTLSSVQMRNKTGVDPHLMFNPRLANTVKLHKKGSDEFFSELGSKELFDVVFLDGLHTFKQTSRDFVNSLRHLKPNGVIVIDDVVPSSREKALPDRKEAIDSQLRLLGVADGEWFGDVWKVPVAVHQLYAGFLEVRTIGRGVCGQAIIRRTPGASPPSQVKVEDLEPFESLRFDDYFLESGEILLPSWTEASDLSWLSRQDALGPSVD